MKRRITITIKPTNGCNMRCSHCYHAEEGFDNKMLDPEHAKRILWIAAQEYEEIRIVFHGGEPTLWGVDNFRNVLAYETELMTQYEGLVIKNSIQSNGLLFNNEWIRLFTDYKFVIGISFDGPHNNDLRTHTETVYNNMRALKAHNLNFGVLCVESALSIDKLKTTYEWFNQEGFNFKILALFMSGSAKNHAEYELDIDTYVNSVVDLYKYWLFDKNCHISVRTFEDLLKISDRLYCLQYGGTCIYNRICLNPNGDLFPCGRPYTEEFVLGNIRDTNLISDAFKSVAYIKLASISEARRKQCREKCDYFGVCKGGCVSSAILEGSFEKIDNVTCVRAKKMLGAITEVNNGVFKLYDEKIDLNELNPKALKIMDKSRNGRYNYSNIK